MTAITDTKEKKIRQMMALQLSHTLPEATKKKHSSCLLKSNSGFSQEGKG